jgi:Fur family ferric uptake transcriptional regulator
MAINKKHTDYESKIIGLLKEKELSITVPRKMILNVLLKEHGPFTAEDIFKKLPKNSCDQVTIYRCLKQFVDTKLVSTSSLEKDLTHYEYNDPNHHHHHVICTICKKIDSFHDCILDKIELNLAKLGYKNIEHRLEFFGVCEECQL